MTLKNILKMYSTSDLQIFVRAADAGSLSQAARELGHSAAVASAALKRLEQRLGSALFVRSTRSLRLTREGEIFLASCRNALAALAEGEAILADARNRVHGPIRLAAPSDLGRTVLQPLLDRFQERHPAVTLTVHFTDRINDLRRDPIDLAFRYGHLDDSSLVYQRLLENRPVVVASPAYLARHPLPKVPSDLLDHNCLLYYLRSKPYNTWYFQSGDETIEVKVRGDRIADDASVVHEWALAGHGIAYKSLLDVRRSIAEGRLIRLLDNFSAKDYPLNVVYPQRNALTPAARALVAFLRVQLRGN